MRTSGPSPNPVNRPPEKRRRWSSAVLSYLGRPLKWRARDKVAGVAFLSLTAVVVGALVWADSGSDGGREPTEDAQIGTRAAQNPLAGREVYLGPDDPRHLIASLDVLDESGIEVVHSFADLQASVDKTTAAIIIDRAFAAQLDRDWVRLQYERGIVIVGIGINMSEMPSALGAPVGVSGDFGSYPESRLFYSLVAKQPCGGGASEDYLDLHPQGQFNLLIHRMANQATTPNYDTRGC